MVERIRQGYQEIEHTADWALKVWAPDLACLLLEAAHGMTALMEIKLDDSQTTCRNIEFTGEDAESLLVAFLSEILFFGESEGMGFAQGKLSLRNCQLAGELVLHPIKSQRKEIKAVTYHNLAIREIDNGLETLIVFDV